MSGKVVLGLSGGMDSAYAALKLLQSGFDILGVYLVMNARCDRSGKAAALAKQLGIELAVIDARSDFEENVIRPFSEAYVKGLTPNPCVMCNQTVKFRRLFAEAERIGADFVATGHYTVPVCRNGRFTLAPARDTKKDQGYFLYGLSQTEISKFKAPLGDVLKDDIKKYFRENSLRFSPDSSESTDICFVNGDSYTETVASYAVLPPDGDFVDLSGNVLGRHHGIYRYTIGQRKGLGISLGAPAYVYDINPESNTVVLSFGRFCGADSFKVKNINCLSAERPEEGMHLRVRTRYRAKTFSCIVKGQDGGCIRVEFEKESCAAPPGQSAVFYNEDGSIAFGGVISR